MSRVRELYALVINAINNNEPTEEALSWDTFVEAFDESDDNRNTNVKVRDGVLFTFANSTPEKRELVADWFVDYICNHDDNITPATAPVQAVALMTGLLFLNADDNYGEWKHSRYYAEGLAERNNFLGKLLNTAITNNVPSRVFQDSLNALTLDECLDQA